MDQSEKKGFKSLIPFFFLRESRLLKRIILIIPCNQKSKFLKSMEENWKGANHKLEAYFTWNNYVIYDRPQRIISGLPKR